MSSIIALRAQIENITAPIHSPQTQRMVFISNLRLLSGWGSARPVHAYGSEGEREGEGEGAGDGLCVFVSTSVSMKSSLCRAYKWPLWSLLITPPTTPPLARGDPGAILKTAFTSEKLWH